MASINVNVGKPLFFNGSNYDYWKTRMMIYLKAMGGDIWNVVEDGFVVLDPKKTIHVEKEKILANA